MAKRYRRQADEEPQNQRDLETALPDQVTDLRTKSSHAECSRTFHMITTEIAQEAVGVKKISILVTTQGLEAAAPSRRFFEMQRTFHLASIRYAAHAAFVQIRILAIVIFRPEKYFLAGRERGR
jgi:hypothetical protein